MRQSDRGLDISDGLAELRKGLKKQDILTDLVYAVGSENLKPKN
jgi:hypothetical protein